MISPEIGGIAEPRERPGVAAERCWPAISTTRSGRPARAPPRALTPSARTLRRSSPRRSSGFSTARSPRAARARIRRHERAAAQAAADDRAGRARRRGRLHGRAAARAGPAGLVGRARDRHGQPVSGRSRGSRSCRSSTTCATRPASAGELRRRGLGRLVNGIRFLLALPRLTRLARRAEVVHTQGWEIPQIGLVAMICLRLSGTPVVQTLHGTFERVSSFLRTRRAARELDGAAGARERSSTPRPTWRGSRGHGRSAPS